MKAKRKVLSRADKLIQFFILGAFQKPCAIDIISAKACKRSLARCAVTKGLKPRMKEWIGLRKGTKPAASGHV